MAAKPPSCLKMEEDRLSIFSTYGLQWCLTLLDKEEFQTYKELLKRKHSELTVCALPPAMVDGAGPGLLAPLLHEHYVGPLAWAVSINIFEEMNLPTVSEKARDEMKKYALSKISDDFEQVEAYHGPSITDVAETSQDAKQDNAAAETCDQDDGDADTDAREYRDHLVAKLAKTPSEPRSPEGPADWPDMKALLGAFHADQRGFRPHTVVLHGKPGSGKSALARKVVLGWAQGRILQNLFSFVFFLSAREIKWAEESSLAALVSRAWPGSRARVTEILSRPQRLLFVVDGLDNPDAILGEDRGRPCGDRAQTQPAWALLRGLLTKALLPASSLLVTVSDAHLERLGALLVSPRYFLVRGLSVQERARACLERVAKDPGPARALRSVMDSRPLLDQCGDAEACLLVSEALRLEDEPGQSVAPRRTLTGLYAAALFPRLAPDGGRLGAERRATLSGLCQMAARGLWDAQEVFTVSDLRAHGLEEAQVSALFGTPILIREEGPGDDNDDNDDDDSFTFLHPSLQHFCAALYYVLAQEEEPGDGGQRSGDGPSGPGHMGSSPGLVSARRFLFGLLSPDCLQALEALLGRPVPPALGQGLVSWVSLLGPQAAALPGDVLDAFYCLFETQDAELARQALSGVHKVRLSLTRRMDLVVSSFCLQHCPQLRTARLDVQDLFSGNGLAEAWSPAPLGTQPKALGDEWWDRFCSVLSNHPTLQQLDLGSSSLDQWAMKSLCTKLRQPTCKIQKLILKKADVTSGLRHLWMALITNPHLKHLNLGSTPLEDCQVEVACQALRHPHCSLQTLRLDSCGLSSTAYLTIAQMLNSATSLTSLSLAGNLVTEEGVAPLCEALRAPQCALRELILDNCGLTAAGCRNLASALNSNHSLVHLCLSNNHVGSDGMGLLCRSIKLPGSRLQSLVLQQCGLGVAGCGFLGFALVSGGRLRHLSLSANPFGDEGAKILFEALRDPSCRLRDLEVVNCHLTLGCCRNLSGVISRNTYLKSLDLAANALGDRGVAVLCEGLRDSTLRRLGLEACGLTAGACEALATALSSHRHLASLNLVRNDFGLEGIRKLCSAFARPTCHLRVLGLWKQQYPAQIRKQLEELQLLKPHLVIDGSWYSLNEDGRFWWKN